MSRPLSRRQLLQGGAGALAGAGLASWGPLANRIVERALAASTGGCGSLGDIEHIVILIQENRSFDHYFGTLQGVDGFADPAVPKLDDGSGLSIFAQPGYPGGYDGGHLYPFHLDSYSAQGECTNDIDHGWATQHQGWNGGRLDRILEAHLSSNGPKNGPLTMGYYTRRDLPFYHALADAFTICDHYHCSVIGPTDPNRLYTLSATLDPDGRDGGPLIETLTSNRLQTYGKFTWKTMPEVLQESGVSWKVYESPENLSPVSDYVLPYFKAYYENPQLAAGAFGHAFPGDFQLDCAAGTLPQVSWVLAPVLTSEHPPLPPVYGEWVTAQVLNALLSNQAQWEKTALLVTYDENGGFFDHVPPPTAPAGTPGEYITVPLGGVAGADGIAGPVGLGFRVPMLVVSPFSRGGFVASDTFDHTSTLKLLASRFAAQGVHVPNLSAWRDATVGDMTTAFNFARVDVSKPSLPQPSLLDQRVLSGDCTTSAPASEAFETGPLVQYAPVTVNRAPPAQEPGRRPAPSGPVRCRA